MSGATLTLIRRPHPTPSTGRARAIVDDGVAELTGDDTIDEPMYDDDTLDEPTLDEPFADEPSTRRQSRSVI